jgi:hypothetical protein
MVEKMIEYGVLDKIERTQSILEKKEIFRQFCKKKENMDFVRLTFNNVEYKIAKKTMNEVMDKVSSENIWILSNSSDEEIIDEINNLPNFSGNILKKRLIGLFSNMDDNQKKWFRRAILHNLEMGFDIKLVNHVLREENIPEIYLFEKPQLCGTIKVKDYIIQFPDGLPESLIMEEKWDGCRTFLIKKEQNIEIVSRNGKKYRNFRKIEEELLKLDYDIILDCEIVADCEGSSIENYQKLTTMLQRIDNIPDFPIKAVIFDVLMVGVDDLTTKTQFQRKMVLKSLKLTYPFVLSPFVIVSERKKIQDFFEEVMKNRGEGVILKHMDLPYKSDSRDRWWKIKPIVEDTFVVTGYGYGEGKNNQDKIGYLEIDVDGKKNRVGSGFNDEMVEYMTKNKDMLVGRQVDIKYTERTRDNRLRFPRFIGFRGD